MHSVLGLCLCGLLAAVPAWAETVELEVSPGVMATARYAPGEGDAQPVLILHGFLQTADFATVRRLHDNLADSGYAVLSPTLSLGIDRRRQSLACEALHLNTLEEDTQELRLWLDWLYRRHGRAVALVSHSAGGLAMTRLLRQPPVGAVARVVLISIDPLAGSAPGAADRGAIHDYTLGHCRRYPSTPESFHSYKDWGVDGMLEAMRGFAGPVAVILGDKDDRIDAHWRRAIRDADIELIEIEGAGHFFDNAHEFDLLDTVEAQLQRRVM